MNLYEWELTIMKRKSEDGKYVKTWTDADEEFLINNYNKFSTEYIAYLLSKSVGSVSTKCKRLKLKKEYHSIPWTPDEKIFVINNIGILNIQDMMIQLKTKTTKNIESFIKQNQGKIAKDDDRWTYEDDRYLLNNYNTSTYYEISRCINKPIWSIKNRVNFLKILKKKPKTKRWQKWEDEYILKNHMSISNDEISLKLQCTQSQLSYRIKKLGLESTVYYSDDDIIFLKENYNTLSIRELADNLKRSENAVRSKLCELGLKGTWWETHEDDFIVNNHKNMTIGEMCASLNRSYSGVMHRLGKLNIKISRKEYCGMLFDSNQELEVFKFIKERINPNITKNSISFKNEEVGESYVPDFILDYSGKSVIIEYYGMYIENVFHKRFEKYIEKADRKNKYYSNMEDYIFIALYPKDLKNDFKGVSEKLAPFVM